MSTDTSIKATAYLASCIVDGITATDPAMRDRIVVNIENKIFELQDVETATSDGEQEVLKAAWSQITGKPLSCLLRNPIV